MKNNLSSYIISINKQSNSLKTTPKHYSESQLSKKNSNSLLINSNKKSNSSYLNSTPYNNYYKNNQKIINFQKPTYSEIQRKIINSHNSSNKKKKKNLKKNLSTKDKAAIKIQSVFRGYINRLKLYNNLKIFYDNNKELIWSIYLDNNPTSYLNDVFNSKNLPTENMRKIIDKYKNYLIDGNEDNYYNNNNFNDNDNNDLNYHYNISSYYKNKDKNSQIINNELNEKIEDENNLYNNNNNSNNIDNENESYIKNTLNNNLIKKIKNKEKEKINNIKTLKNKLFNIFLTRKKNIFFKLKIFYDFCVKNNYNFNILINIGFFNTNKNNDKENDSEEKNNFIDDNIVNNNNLNNYNEYKNTNNNNNNNSSSNSYRKKIYKNYSNNNINNKTNSDNEDEPYLNEIEDPDLTKKVCQYLLLIDHKLNGTKYDKDNSKNNNEQLFRIFRRAFISNNNNNIDNSDDNNILNSSINLSSKRNNNNNIEKDEVIYKRSYSDNSFNNLSYSNRENEENFDNINNNKKYKFKFELNESIEKIKLNKEKNNENNENNVFNNKEFIINEPLISNKLPQLNNNEIHDLINYKIPSKLNLEKNNNFIEKLNNINELFNNNNKRDFMNKIIKLSKEKNKLKNENVKNFKFIIKNIIIKKENKNKQNILLHYFNKFKKNTLLNNNKNNLIISNSNKQLNNNNNDNNIKNQKDLNNNNNNLIGISSIIKPKSRIKLEKNGYLSNKFLRQYFILKYLQNDNLDCYFRRWKFFSIQPKKFTAKKDKNIIIKTRVYFDEEFDFDKVEKLGIIQKRSFNILRKDTALEKLDVTNIFKKNSNFNIVRKMQTKSIDSESLEIEKNLIKNDMLDKLAEVYDNLKKNRLKNAFKVLKQINEKNDTNNLNNNVNNNINNNNISNNNNNNINNNNNFNVNTGDIRTLTSGDFNTYKEFIKLDTYTEDLDLLKEDKINTLIYILFNKIYENKKYLFKKLKKLKELKDKNLKINSKNNFDEDNKNQNEVINKEFNNFDEQNNIINITNDDFIIDDFKNENINIDININNNTNTNNNNIYDENNINNNTNNINDDNNINNYYNNNNNINDDNNINENNNNNINDNEKKENILNKNLKLMLLKYQNENQSNNNNNLSQSNNSFRNINNNILNNNLYNTNSSYTSIEEPKSLPGWMFLKILSFVAYMRIQRKCKKVFLQWKKEAKIYKEEITENQREFKH